MERNPTIFSKNRRLKINYCRESLRSPERILTLNVHLDSTESKSDKFSEKGVEQFGVVGVIFTYLF